MNTAIKYANENGVEALKEALPASFNPSLNESIVLDGVRINLKDAFDVIAAVLLAPFALLIIYTGAMINGY